MLAPIARYPLYFGTTLFALEAVGVVIALENNMENPKDFGSPCGVLNVGMVIIVFLYGELVQHFNENISFLIKYYFSTCWILRIHKIRG